MMLHELAIRDLKAQIEADRSLLDLSTELKLQEFHWMNGFHAALSYVLNEPTEGARQFVQKYTNPGD